MWSAEPLLNKNEIHNEIRKSIVLDALSHGIVPYDCGCLIVSYMHEFKSHPFWWIRLMQKKVDEIQADHRRGNPDRLIGGFGFLALIPLGVLGCVLHVPMVAAIGFIFGVSGGYKLWTGSPEPLGPVSRWFRSFH